MIALSLGELAALVDGRLVDGADPLARVVGPVEFDSREISPGGLFLALPGERTDGHEHAAAALAAGALAAVVARPVGVPAVLVGDVRAALCALARAVVDGLPDLCVVGVTGSSGKTSTKDLLIQLLAGLGRTVGPRGSFNNELGHPYTVLQAAPDTRFLVLEYSARGRGDIAALCAVAAPRIGVVLNVGAAHLGVFGSREAIARTKGELVEALPPAAAGGVAVLNADDPVVRAMSGRTAARVVLAGRAADADVRASDLRLDDLARPAFVLHARGDQARVGLELSGEHQVANALAAAAVGLELGMSVARVAAALGAARARSPWRMEVTTRPDGVTVINDAYNANPESMRAALRALVAMARGRRSWAVLGHMAELGAAADAEHDALGRLVRTLGVDRSVVVGPLAAGIQRGTRSDGRPAAWSVRVEDIDSAVALLREQLRPGDVVLVKASRAAGLERLAARLVERAEDRA